MDKKDQILKSINQIKSIHIIINHLDDVLDDNDYLDMIDLLLDRLSYLIIDLLDQIDHLKYNPDHNKMILNIINDINKNYNPKLLYDPDNDIDLWIILIDNDINHLIDLLDQIKSILE